MSIAEKSIKMKAHSFTLMPKHPFMQWQAGCDCAKQNRRLRGHVYLDSGRLMSAEPFLQGAVKRAALISTGKPEHPGYDGLGQGHSGESRKECEAESGVEQVDPGYDPGTAALGSSTHGFAMTRR